MKNIIIGFLALGLAWASPLELIKKKDQQLQALLKGYKINKSVEKQEELKSLINSIFNFKEMGRKALGSKVWKAASPEKQEEFVSAFKIMIENASVKKLEVYESERTEYDDPTGNEKKAKITAHVFNDGKESILVYKMKPFEGEWQAWDLIIDDLSTMRNYREQFKTILETKTLTELIEILKKKA